MLSFLIKNINACRKKRINYSEAEKITAPYQSN